MKLAPLDLDRFGLDRSRRRLAADRVIPAELVARAARRAELERAAAEARAARRANSPARRALARALAALARIARGRAVKPAPNGASA